MIDLGDVYEGQDLAAIRVAEWDQHPNARAHRLIAERLYGELLAQRGAIFPAMERLRPKKPEPSR